MGIINRLDKQVAELIAAGEVVERPASVVKELLENAIDAGASAITVEIQNGGMTFLRVSDNGSGMYREDVPTAFLSHATSKVRTADDLEGICTLGFRGEALASIAAVAKVEVLTRREEEVCGTRYAIEGGMGGACQDAGCPKGTTILVRELFYNTPARLKFLKKDNSEANAVAGVVDKIAIAYPEIAFKLIRDGELRRSTPGDGKLLSAIYAVFGRDFAKTLREVRYENGGLALQGYLSKPEDSRANRTMQHFYINRRFVKSRTCTAALEEGYKGAIMAGKFPACILNVKVEPHTVDVNVHPAKIEVRFANEKPVFDLVYFGVKNTLSALSAPVFQPSIAAKKPVVSGFSSPQMEQQRMDAGQFRQLMQHNAGGQSLSSLPPFSQGKTPTIKKAEPEAFRDDGKGVPYGRGSGGAAALPKAPQTAERADGFAGQPYGEKASQPVKAYDLPPFCTEETTPSCPAEPVDRGAKTEPAFVSFSTKAPLSAQPSPEEDEEQALPANPYANAKMVGELFGTYLLLECGEQLLLVDKHAAHERILFNRIRQNQADQFSQSLLSPVAVNLSAEEYTAALEHLPVLTRCGFEAEDFGSGCLLVRTAPMWIGEGEIQATVSELCANLAQNRQDITPERLNDLYHSVACRSAIKAHDKSSRWELSALVEVLAQDGTIQHCPHGRPVSISISRKELEKQFGRIV